MACRAGADRSRRGPGTLEGIALPRARQPRERPRDAGRPRCDPPDRREDGAAKNVAVADDTAVSFTTDLGTVTSISATAGGLTSVSLLMPPKTAGTARIVATVGTIRSEKSVSVSC